MLWSILGDIYVVMVGIIFLLSYGCIYGIREDISIGWLASIILVIGGIVSLGTVIGNDLDICNDDISRMSKGIIYLSSGLCIGGSLNNGKLEKGMEFSMIILMSSVGLSLMLSSKDLMFIYLGLEMQALGFYILSTYRKSSAYGTEGGLKYFVLGVFGSGLLLMGISLMYGILGTVDLESIGRLLLGSSLEENFLIKVSVLLILMGFVLKLGGAPFHSWVPDVYEGVGSSVLKYFVVVPKIGVLSVILRISFEIPEEFWKSGLLLISVLSLLVSMLGTLYQRKVKRFIGYSSIGHVGFMLIGIVSGELELVYTYAILYMLTMLVVCEIVERLGITYIDEVGRLRKENNYLGVSLSIIMFSLAGTPPLGGFFMKMFILKGAILSGNYLVAIVSVLVSVVSAYYYLRWVKIIYFDIKVENGIILINRRLLGLEISSYTIGLLVIGLSLIFINPEIF